MERAMIFITAYRSCLPWFFKKKITITCNTFLYKPGRKITSSGNGMCREGVIQVDDYRTHIVSKHMCPLNVMLPSFLHSVPSRSKIFVFKVRNHLECPVAEQRQEEEFHSFKEPNCWATQAVLENQLALTWEKDLRKSDLVMFCGKLASCFATLEGKNGSFDLPSEFAQLFWQMSNLAVNLSDKWKCAVRSEICTQLGQRPEFRKTSSFFLDKLNWTSILSHIHELKWHLNS